MATRAQVIISNREGLSQSDYMSNAIWNDERLQWLINQSCILYHHRDGYPENMVPSIFDVLNLPHGRLTDIEYLNAIMLWYWKHTENDLTTKLAANPDKGWDDEELYRTLWLSHWVSNEIHWDTQYIYLVHAESKTVHVLEYNYDDNYWFVSASYNNVHPFTS